MHIGIVAQYADPDRGGHEKFLHRLCEGLLEKGHRITFFAYKFGEFQKNSVNVNCVSVPVLSFPQSLRYLSFNYFARQKVRRHKENLDVLFTTGFVTFGDVYRAGGGLHEEFLKQQNSSRWIPKLSDIIKLQLQKRLFANEDLKKIIVNSYMVGKQIANKYPELKEKIDTVYNGVDTAKFNPSNRVESKKKLCRELELNEQLPLFLFAGREPKRKGLDILFKSIVELDQKFNLIIAGLSKNEIKRFLNKKTKELQKNGSLKIIEYESDIVKLYKGAELFILPTRYDPAANVVLESLACGTPVITTENNGAKELIEEGKNGHIIKSADSIALQEKLRIFLENDSEVKKWHPTQDFLDSLDIKNTIQKILSILNDC